MSRIAYVNGRYRPHAAAQVSIEDRGFQFADGVYEVWAVLHGGLVDAEGHFTRLERSLAELCITAPMTRVALEAVLRETLRRNRIHSGIVYLQVTRGVARRDHAFPPEGTPPSMIVTARAFDPARLEARAATGATVITVPETRWARCDIKTVGLLPNVLAKDAARQAGGDEAWFVDADDLVTEGASTNAWIVDADGVLRTRDTGANILRGVTRASVIGAAERLQIRVEERPFTVTEARTAREVFFTAATAFVTPVVRLDDMIIGDGRPGPVTKALRGLYLRDAEKVST